VDDNSDAGGVAARLGFKYQDHVAAFFVLQMIDDRRILQVECETSDDITLIAQRYGVTTPEYIQVKTTDKDTNWTLTELTARPPQTKSKPTSLVEKSLLTDKHLPGARFRVVARRPLNKAVSALMEPVERRDPKGGIATLAGKLQARHPSTTSANGNDLAYWTLHAQWDVLSSIDHVENRNLQAISRIAEASGANPTHSHARTIYRDLLNKVDEAASNTRKRPDDKIITRQQALEWWRSHLEQTHAAQARTSKPYRARGERFFVEIHKVEADALRRSSSGYDAQYERGVWRSRQLARHLADWVPELTLRASELVEINPLNMREKLEAGVRAIRAERELDLDQLLGETLLHAVLRHWFGSEPVACKLFHRSAHGDRVTKNAHVVHAREGDQLWIGRTHLFDGAEAEDLLTTVRDELIAALETEILVEERNTILQLREPQHHTDNTLGEALRRSAPIDEFIRVLCLPILIAYNSQVLRSGHAEDYQRRLTDEVTTLADRFTSVLPGSLQEVQVHVFLVPVESLANLGSQFAECLGLA
jgi:hypothetical protein